ncbi:MAG: hypothetical protein H7A09_00840 [Oceanospirillaceae bacterium]|nr:hypothetical protein [Oceanospirillaceae bacterium]
MESNVHIRHTRITDIPALIAMQKRVYPDIPSWNPQELEKQISIFPQGQILAETEQGIVGCASSLVVMWDE